MSAIPAAQLAVLVQVKGLAEASRALSSVDGDLRKTAGTAGRAAKDLEDTGKRGSNAMGGIKTAAKALGGLAIGAGLVTGLKSAVGAYEDSRKVAAQTNSVIKSTGGAANVTAKEVSDLASAISKKTGIDDEAIQKGSNLLLTFKNIRNEAGAGRDIFDQTTQAAVDLSAAGFGSIDSASKQLGKALNDPIKGMTALGRSGVTFSEDQKKAIEALMETGKAGDRVKAQQIILQEVNSQVGGSAAAQATAMDHLKVTLGNLQETIGGVVIGTVDALARALVGVIDTVGSVVDWFKKHETVTLALATAVGVVLTAFLGFKALAAVQAAIVAVRGAMLALNAAFLTNPVVLVVTAIAALAAGLVIAYRESETFRDIVNGVWNVIKDAAEFVFPLIADAVKVAWEAIKLVTETVWGAITGFLEPLWDGLKTTVTTLFNAYKTIVEGVWGGIKTVSETVWGTIKTVLKDAWAAIKTAATTAWDLIKGVIIDPIRAVVGLIKGALGSDGLMGWLGDAWDAIKGAARSAWNAFGTLIVDPVRDAVGAVRNAINNVIEWLGDRADDIGKAAKKLAKPFVDAFDSMKNAVKDVLDFLGKIIDKVESVIDLIGKIKIPKIDIPIIGGGVGGGNVGPGGQDPAGFAAITASASRFGNVVTSGYRPGDPGYHGMNRARDYAGGNMLGFAKFMMAMYGSRLKELIYTPMGVGIKNGQPVDIRSYYGPAVAADHFDHVHVAMAAGGHVRQGGWAMVGELGPELVRLPSGSTVYPNGTGPAGGPAPIVHVHFDDPSLKSLVRVEIEENGRRTAAKWRAGVAT